MSFDKVNSSTKGCACVHFLSVRAHKSVQEEARRKESFYMNAVLINSGTIEPKEVTIDVMYASKMMLRHVQCLLSKNKRKRR